MRTCWGSLPKNPHLWGPEGLEELPGFPQPPAEEGCRDAKESSRLMATSQLIYYPH